MLAKHSHGLSSVPGKCDVQLEQTQQGREARRLAVSLVQRVKMEGKDSISLLAMWSQISDCREINLSGKWSLTGQVFNSTKLPCSKGSRAEALALATA